MKERVLRKKSGQQPGGVKQTVTPNFGSDIDTRISDSEISFFENSRGNDFHWTEGRRCVCEKEERRYVCGSEGGGH